MHCSHRNGTPGYDNRRRLQEMEVCCGDVWTYARFDPAGDDLNLELVALYHSEDEEMHSGV